MKKQGTLENQANSVYLAFGSNLGDRKKNLNKALKLLNKENVVIKSKSKLYRSKSWPNENFPEFINFVIFIETNLNLKKLFLKIKNIESKVGRVKSKRNFPRVCDIDIIDFNSRIIQKKIGNNKINVPHEKMHCRNFVHYTQTVIMWILICPLMNKLWRRMAFIQIRYSTLDGLAE